METRMKIDLQKNHDYIFFLESTATTENHFTPHTKL